MSYRDKINMDRIPQHVAIIMDGNGRWAKQKGKARTFGHQAGAQTVHTIASEAARLGIKYLTLYTFSTENWNRPADEVAALMALLIDSIEEDTFMKNNIRFRIIGNVEKLPKDVLTRLNQCIEHTSKNTGMNLILALSYSSKWELTEATKQIAQEVKENKLEIDSISEKVISAHLTTNFMSDPDFLIRTGGEIRLSNYLLWQCAYTELYFCNTYWPDFNKEELWKAICDYQQRERRFGKTSEQI
ncbi:isoprenyl transferase [Phocaeicola oris]|uniref:isoprenyl transferase n=1 Tax=Phocaeicola oris TaxID=2896850 RepID=UPI00234F47AE|nr:isoprenyl transferase [Phocaeicola oris]MCE2617260.1 isoprenyl transferase [Phocaeicola oris]